MNSPIHMTHSRVFLLPSNIPVGKWLIKPNLLAMFTCERNNVYYNHRQRQLLVLLQIVEPCDWYKFEWRDDGHEHFLDMVEVDLGLNLHCLTDPVLHVVMKYRHRWMN